MPSNLWWGIERVARPASTPPFLQYQWIMITLARAPPYMLREGRFVSVWMKVFVDGVNLAWRAIGKNTSGERVPSASIAIFNLTLS